MDIKTIKSYSRVVRYSFEMTIRSNMVDAFILFTIIVQPMLIAILAIWMLQERGGDYAIFVVVGSGMSGLWNSLLYVSGNSITGERWYGTLENLVGSPTPIQVVVFGKALAQVSQSLLSMVASYALVAYVFQLPLHVEQPLVFFVSIVITILGFVCFGLIMASLFVVNPEVQRWQNGLEFPVFILAGFLFPIALLPEWTTPLSYLLTPYWATRIMHAATNGLATPAEIALSWGMIFVFSFFYLAISNRLFQTMIRKARVDATLGLQ